MAEHSWLRTLIRLWSLRRPAEAPSVNSGPAVAALAAVWLAAWAYLDRLQRQPDPIFDAEGIPLLGWYVLGVLALAAIMRSRAAPRPAFGPVAVIAMGLVWVPVAWLLAPTAAADEAVSHWQWIGGAVATLYTLIYLSRGLFMITGRRQTGAAVAGTAFTLLFVLVSERTNAIPDVFTPREADVTQSDDELALKESALFEQADRIDRALEDVRRDGSPRAQAFFLGFAGYGEQKVFTQEISLASRVLGERYATSGRQVTLANDERDLERVPLASVSALGYALKGIAAHMKLDRDVLFLSISSHGSPDGTVAVANSGFPFVDLSAEDLASALNDAGIRWRVILISACYAGAFIEPLRDAHTVLITAAAADRTSFGCSTDSDLTYFGEAFYRDALPEAASLHAAFEAAQRAIASREADEGDTPSQPQAYFGFDVDDHLAGVGRHGPREPEWDSPGTDQRAPVERL